MPSREPEEMERMTFVEHLTELRSRLIKALLGLAVAFAVSLTFTDPLWRFICRPAAQALQSLGYPPQLYVFDPMDGFQIIWVKLPVVWAIFLASVGSVPGLGLHRTGPVSARKTLGRTASC